MKEVHRALCTDIASKNSFALPGIEVKKTRKKHPVDPKNLQRKNEKNLLCTALQFQFNFKTCRKNAAICKSTAKIC